MNAIKKFIAKGDSIPPPYSTLVTILLVTAIPVYILYTVSVGCEIGFAKGVIVGCVLTILFKWSLESSDKENWQKIKGVFGFGSKSQ